MCFRTMAEAVKVECSTSGEKLVLLMLADRANSDTGDCYPSHSRLAKDCCMDVSSVKRHIKNLADKGYITIIHRTHEGVNLSNSYRFNLSGVGSSCTQGGVIVNGGVGSPCPTNLEVEPIKEPITPPLTLGVVVKESVDHNLLFEKFWNAYGKKVGRKETLALWMKLKPTAALLDVMLKGIDAYKARQPDPKYRKDPVRWLKGEGWNDEASSTDEGGCDMFKQMMAGLRA